ncbi:flagellar hook-length control protein FliK [Alcanivorax sp. MM125-6]|nr:flagellar hook-length control protein FliK [Alcanivorax sp. MM125-6]
MELHLNPRDLGPLSVSLKLDDHGAQAHFFSSHAPVRGAVEQAIPQLRDALAEQGIALGEAMVGDQPRQQFNEQTGDGQPNSAPALADAGDDAAVTGAEPTRATTVLPTSGVDLYA